MTSPEPFKAKKDEDIRTTYEQYLSSLSENSVVYRLTPESELEANPYENPAVIPAQTHYGGDEGYHTSSCLPAGGV